VDEATVHNWEVHATQPELRHLPKIIRFLGYNPLPAAGSLAEQIARHRRTLGLSRRELAKRLGVDPGTLWKWEAGIREPKGKYLKIVKSWLADSQVKFT
jgi:DNA-binding transcriptional regulator YiaG